MKAHVLFDEAGRVGAILHLSTETKAANDASRKPLAAGFSLREGQQEAILEIPSEVVHLKPRELHDSVHVDLSGASPRLAANPK
jgi:hypothetical protein